MKFTNNIFKIVAIILCFSFVSFAQTNWEGEFFFGEDGGETAGGSKIYIAHTIKITKKDGKLDAHIYSQGFQTSRDIYADAKIIGNKLELYYREKGTDHYGSDYQKGVLLLTLEKKKIAKKTKILTVWNTFTPMLDVNAESNKVYFKKIKSQQQKIKSNK